MNSKLILYTFEIFIISSEILLKVESFQCPEKFGHFADSNDCNRYYVCNHGRSLIQKCDDGLLYNTFLKTCDWPRNVQCDKGGKRVNTRRNPDIKKTSYKTHKSEFEESNQLSPDNNSDQYNGYNSPSNEDTEHNKYGSGQYPPPDNNRNPVPDRRSELKINPPQWQIFAPKQQISNTQSRGPASRSQSPANYNTVTRNQRVRPLPPPTTTEGPPEEQPRIDYEYDTPDYYEYEAEAPVRHIRKPVKEEEEVEEVPPKPNDVESKEKGSSVKRIGWLPEDPDSNKMNEYHWSPKDAVGYSKDKPKIPDEAYVTMKDFRNVEKQLAEDNTPNEGPEPEEGEEYDDYYEDDEEPPQDEEEDYHNHHHHHEDEETTPAPPTQLAPLTDNRSPKVRYDDEEEVKPQPRVPPQALPRPPKRQRVPVPVTPPPPRQYSKPVAPHKSAPTAQKYSKPGGEPYSRPVKQPDHSNDEISGLRSVANKYESVPKAISAAKTTDQLTKPIIKTNIHYKNINSPYLRPLLDEKPNNRISDNSYDNYNKGILIKSVPRNDVKPKKRVVIRRVVKQNKTKPKLMNSSSESVTPSIYQLLDDYRKEMPQTLLTHKQKAQEFRDSLIHNYMNNEKPNYILNDNDFTGVKKTYTVPRINGEGDDSNSGYVRDFDKDFQSINTKQSVVKQNKLGSDRNSFKSKQNNNNYNNYDKNRTSDKNISDKTGHFLNTDAIVKQQRAQDSFSPLFVTTVSPPAEKVTKKPSAVKPPKRNTQTFPTHFGFKHNVVISTTTTIRPTPIPTQKPKIRIKTTPKVNPNPTENSSKKRSEWYQTVDYEPNTSNTAINYERAHKCDSKYCRLPDCRCGGTDIPGALQPKQTPQIILLTFDDSVNDLNWEIYDELFNSGRNNPNGCPILATFYVSHEWTDYAQVQSLYSKGHEIASHSITYNICQQIPNIMNYLSFCRHSFGEKFSKELWLKEIAGQREILTLFGGVKDSDVRGMRAPFLQTGGNTMFEMLYESNFTYDSSLPVYEINPPYFPYTLDYAITHECMIAPCPTKSFTGLWEIGMVMWEDLRNGRCSMADACFNPKDEQGVYDMVKKNFDRHYNTNRAPFGIYFHSRWFLTDHNRKGFLKFMDEINGLNDVYFVTNWQMIQWMRDPQPINNIQGFKPWSCDYSDRPQECSRPNECKVKLKSETRVFKTCQPCPKTYPWRGNNGLKYLN